MPYGKGTYGSKVGRPKKKKLKQKAKQDSLSLKKRKEFLKKKKMEKDLSKPLNKKGRTLGDALDRVASDAMYPDVESPTDWTKGPGMMEINVKDYVKAAHSINPPKNKKALKAKDARNRSKKSY